jgi:hypothetical protein
MDHLTPDGVICFNRWFSDPPIESLRVVNLAREALLRRGVANPADHIMVVRTDPSETLLASLGSILIKMSPFTPAEVASLRAFASDMGFHVPYAPGGAPGGDRDFKELLGPEGPALVARYPYDISAVTDDRPFFFSRAPVLPWLANRIGLFKSPVGNIPLGLGGQTLLVSAGTTAAATGVLLLLPYWVGRRRARARAGGGGGGAGGPGGVDTRRGLAWAVYFTGLGLGFIFVEIVLVQRFSLFLGYPVYSLSVVLFTILLASAAGSLLAGRFTSRRALPVAIGALVAGLVLYALALPPLLAAARGAPIAARIALAVVTIAPLGLLMGMPFPSGIRRAGRESRTLVSWAWAVNGGASVMGSTLTVLISMTYGFTASFLAGAIAYAAALAVVAALPERAP